MMREYIKEEIMMKEYIEEEAICISGSIFGHSHDFSRPEASTYGISKGRELTLPILRLKPMEFQRYKS